MGPGHHDPFDRTTLSMLSHTAFRCFRQLRQPGEAVLGLAARTFCRTSSQRQASSRQRFGGHPGSPGSSTWRLRSTSPSTREQEQHKPSLSQKGQPSRRCSWQCSPPYHRSGILTAICRKHFEDTKSNSQQRVLVLVHSEILPQEGTSTDQLCAKAVLQTKIFGDDRDLGDLEALAELLFEALDGSLKAEHRF